MSPKDLGTYHLRVELADGRGWLDRWQTGARYTNGSSNQSPLDAQRINPTWESEEDLFQSMHFMYTDGNYSCDCNKTLFWCRAQQLQEPEHVDCGDAMGLKRLTVIRPDGSEHTLFEA